MKIEDHRKLKKDNPDVVDFYLNNSGADHLDNILETLQDLGCLSEKGLQFRKKFWEIYIQI